MPHCIRWTVHQEAVRDSTCIGFAVSQDRGKLSMMLGGDADALCVPLVVEWVTFPSSFFASLLTS